MTTHSKTGRQITRVRIPVWDPFLRLFHWLFAAAIATALVSLGTAAEKGDFIADLSNL